jgi:hypothetical protein
MLGRLGQRELLHLRLTDCLIRHDTSAAKDSATGAAWVPPRLRRHAWIMTYHRYPAVGG